MNLSRFLKKIGLTFLVGCMAFAAVSCSEDEDGPGAVGNGTVSGVVTDEQARPIEGVSVSMPANGIETTTSATGEYTLPNVPMTSGIILFEREGYETLGVTVVAKKFTDAKATVNVEMVYANAVIKGVVLDAAKANAPLAGATVKVSEFQTTETNDKGEFELRNLTLKDYSVTVSYPGYKDVVKAVAADVFNEEGVATIEAVMGAEELLRGLTKYQLAECRRWVYNEYRGGRNADDYPHWDWSTDNMCTLDFSGDYEEQNEGTTLRIRNSADDQRNNPVDMEVFDSFVYGRKLITADNHLMTVLARTHNASADAPAYFGIQVVDLEDADAKANLIGGVRTLADENYNMFEADLSDYIGKEVVIAVGTFRQQAGDYWKQLVLRRIAFTAESIPSTWAWLPGTPVAGLEGWNMTMEMVRSTMPNDFSSFTGISPVSGNRDNYFDAYRAWRDVHHVACEWSLMPLFKDPEVFPSEGFLLKTRGDAAVNTKVPEAYMYSKFSIAPGKDKFTLKTRCFSSANATFFKITAITMDGTLKHLSPVSNTATMAEAAADGCWKFIHEAGGPDAPNAYASFVYDLSEFDGQDVVITIGVFKGESNGDENKLLFYSVDLN
jgi:hypothetical protein